MQKYSYDYQNLSFIYLIIQFYNFHSQTVFDKTLDKFYNTWLCQGWGQSWPAYIELDYIHFLVFGC